jgi:hemolysin activation/secretion protein
MFTAKIIPLTLLVLGPVAFAATPLGAGGLMQQIPPTPTPPMAVPTIEIAPVAQSGSSAQDTAKVVVTQIQFTGAAVYPESQLLALTGFVPGSSLSLTDIQAMAARITSYYRQNGYFVAQAYVPAQSIYNGVVTVAIIEGHYGQVTLNNQSRVSNNLAYRLMEGIKTGDPITIEPLESRLLLLSDLPGVKVSSTLVPGAVLGTSDLLVDVKSDRAISGSVDADNAGNRYTGENRIGATINFNEPLGNGDVASLRALTSGQGMSYLRGSYQMQFGKATAGVAYSALRYELGEEFASLHANGTAEVASLYGSYPLKRSRNASFYAGLILDGKKFQDKVDSVGTVADKRATTLTASLSGNQRDNLGGGGLNAIYLAWTAGNIDLQTPAVAALDAVTAQSNGHFNKLSYRVSRQQRATESVSLSASLSGQLPDKNLDVSEKMELGGMYGVRAYPEGEAYADQGYLINLEAQFQLPKLTEKLPGQVQLIGFIDTGRVAINHTPWAAGQNQRTLIGAGVGVNWSEANNFMVRAYYAFKVGSEAATSAPDRDGRFWIQAVKYF